MSSPTVGTLQAPSYYIDSSGVPGQDGKNGTDGSNGGYYGEDGGQGGKAEPGQKGGTALPIDIRLQIREGTLVLESNQGIVDRERESFVGTSLELPLQENSETIAVYARGGNGGDGGHGGRGGHGAPGQAGDDATRSHRGGNGDPGGDAGAGGPAANGAPGGNGGVVDVRYPKDQSHVLMVLEEDPDVSAGQGGKGGQGGPAGKPGPGGPGGDSCHWTTHHTRTSRHWVGVPGRGGHMVSRTQHYTRHHSNPGGSDGPRGANASDGSHGLGALPGKIGKYIIHEESPDGAETTFSRRYNLEIINTQFADDSGDGIFEPGEHVKIRIKVQNTGGMPMPTEQKVHLFVQNSPELILGNPQQSLVLPGGLKEGESCWLEGSLDFQLPHPTLPIRGDCLDQNIYPPFGSRMEEINRGFKSIAEHQASLPVQYPVEIDILAGVHTITPGEEAPLGIRITNVSSKAVGFRHGRPIKANLSPTSQEELFGSSGIVNLIFKDKNGNSSEFGPGIFSSIEELRPGETATLVGTVAFANDKKLPPLTKASVNANLALVPRGTPKGQRNFSTIHQKTFPLQLSPTFNSGDDSEILLIASFQTSEEEFFEWQSLVNDLGVKLSVWNSSLHGGISLESALPSLNNRSLAELFAGKSIVYLNPPDNCHQVPIQEVLGTVVDTGTKLYHVGKPWNLKTHLLPARGEENRHAIYPQDMDGALDRAQEMPGTEAIKAEVQSKGFCGDFPLNDKPEAMADISRKIHSAKPERSFIIVDDKGGSSYPPNQSLCCETWEMGPISILRSTDKHEASILQAPSDFKATSSPEFVRDPRNVYQLIRSLPFKTKLQCLSNSTALEKHGSILEKAIVADIMEQVAFFTDETWMGDLTHAHLKEKTHCLRTFKHFPFEPEKLGLRGRLAVARIAHEIKAYAGTMKTFWDHFFFNRRRKVLANRIYRAADHALEKLGETEDYSPQRRAAKKKIKKASPSDLLQEMLNPMRLGPGSQSNRTTLPHIIQQDNFFKLQPRSMEVPHLVFQDYSFENQAERRKILDELEEALNQQEVG